MKANPRRLSRPRALALMLLTGALHGGLLHVAPVARADEVVGVRCVTFSPDGKRLAVATGDPKQPGTVTMFEAASRKQIWKHTEKLGVPVVAFSPDGRTLAIAVYDNAARLLHVDTGKVTATFPHSKEVRGVAFSPDGRRLATACWDSLVRVWEIASGAELVVCRGHRARIFSVAFSPDGTRLLSVGGNDGAKLWDAATGVEKQTFKHYYMPCAAFTPDGLSILTGSYDGTTRLWSTTGGPARVRFEGTGGVNQLAFSEKAHTLTVCGYGRAISLFDLTLSEPSPKERERIRALLAKLDDDSFDVREAAGKELLGLGFMAVADLQRAAKEANSAEVRIRARRLRHDLLAKPRAQLRGHTGDVESVSFAPDSRTLASGSKDGTVRLWDMTSLKEVACLIPEQ